MLSRGRITPCARPVQSLEILSAEKQEVQRRIRAATPSGRDAETAPIVLPPQGVRQGISPSNSA